MTLVIRVVAGLVLSAVVSIPAAWSETCTPSRHAVRYASGPVDLQSFTCKTQEAQDATAVRVTFHSFSESLAGSLVMETALPELNEIVGRAVIMKNDVYQEIRSLFEKFGSRTDHDSGGSGWIVRSGHVEIDFSKPIPMDTKGDDAKSPRTVWRLTRPSSTMHSDRVFLKAASRTITTTDYWPKDFNMFYDCYDLDLERILSCTNLWRYITPADFNPILTDLRELYQQVEKRLQRNRAEWRERPARDKIPGFERDFEYFRHLARRGWQKELVFIQTKIDPNECSGSEWSFMYTTRPVMLDFVVLENVSDQNLRIDDLVGARSKSDDIRAMSESETLQRTSDGLGLPAIFLAPKQRIVVPLRIRLAEDKVPLSNDDGWREQSRKEAIDRAHATYAKIQSLKPKSVMEQRVGGLGGKGRVRKVRESFLSPVWPVVSDFVYGPELAVTGLVVGGKRLMLDQTRSNLSEAPSPLPDYNASDMIVRPPRAAASCPILYSWNDAEQTWINLGKVIHEARGAGNIATDVVTLPELRTRFRLAEEEPEVAYIQDVRLNLTLSDGRRIQLAPRDKFASVIPAHTSTEIEFELPADVSRDAVVKTEIEITGYYRRYSDIMAEEMPPAEMVRNTLMGIAKPPPMCLRRSLPYTVPVSTPTGARWYWR